MAAAAGARVVMACRNLSKSEPARLEIVKRSGSEKVELVELDVSDLSSCKSFGSRFKDPIDVLVCNAGIMAIDKAHSKDGVEMQFATNVLGHFTLLAVLRQRLQDQKGRVVMVSSGFHEWAKTINLADINRTKSYSRWGVYAETKLADLLIMHKFNRLMKEANSEAFAVGCHPGYAATNLQSGHFMARTFGNWLLAQSQENGALPTFLSASDPNAKPGMYAGPSGYFELKGKPKWGAHQNAAASNIKLQDDLWAKCEELSGVKFGSSL